MIQRVLDVILRPSRTAILLVLICCYVPGLFLIFRLSGEIAVPTLITILITVPSIYLDTILAIRNKELESNRTEITWLLEDILRRIVRDANINLKFDESSFEEFTRSNPNLIKRIWQEQKAWSEKTREIVERYLAREQEKIQNRHSPQV